MGHEIGEQMGCEWEAWWAYLWVLVFRSWLCDEMNGEMVRYFIKSMENKKKEVYLVLTSTLRPDERDAVFVPEPEGPLLEFGWSAGCSLQRKGR